MIRFVWTRLRGPLAARVLQMILIAAGLLAALLVLYDWVGSTFLDPGGTIG